LKKRRKIRSTIKMAASQTSTWTLKIYAIVKMLLGFHFLADEVANSLHLRWPWALGGGPRPLAGRWFHVLCLGCFRPILVSAVRWRLHPEVRIRSSPAYPSFGCASRNDRRRVEVCVLRISWDPVGFCAHWFAFKSDSVTIIVDGCCSSALVL
jgi:hypothetical protein